MDDVEFDIDTGLTCGLIIDELVSNCLKHAFVERAGRCASPCWTMSTGRLRSASMTESGFPKTACSNNPGSLGDSELVSLLAEKLDGPGTDQRFGTESANSFPATALLRKGVNAMEPASTLDREDEPVVAKDIQLSLQRLGYRVPANDVGEDAIRKG